MTTQTFANPFKTELPDDEPLIIMSRTFDAPLALVWKVWTEKEHVAHWWGSATMTSSNMTCAPAENGGLRACPRMGRGG